MLTGDPRRWAAEPGMPGVVHVMDPYHGVQRGWDDVGLALANLEANGVGNVELVRLSAEELTQALNEVRPFRRLAGIDLKSYEFGSVFVDPPRAGMDPDTCELTRRFQRILYISCNPETLAANIAQLSDTHRVTRCALFDQFPYTHHMEAGVLLERR